MRSGTMFTNINAVMIRRDY